MIGIIGAMDEEIKHFLSDISDTQKKEIANMKYYSGKIHDKEIVIVKSGVGKVNSAMCTQAMIDHFRVSKIIFTGVAGGLKPKYNIHDIIVSKYLIQHDVDATARGHRKGELLFTKHRDFYASKELSALAMQKAKELDLTSYLGIILTGDQFINSNLKVAELVEDFDGDCVEMEGGAVAQVCVFNKIPFTAIRTISDKADDDSNIDFDKFLIKASENSYKLVMKILEEI